jgi:hypothetical protein
LDKVELSPPQRQASNGYASGLEHSLNTGVHLIFFDKLTRVRLLDAFSHGGPKLCVLSQPAQGSILLQLLGVGAGASGELMKLSVALPPLIQFLESR